MTTLIRRRFFIIVAVVVVSGAGLSGYRLVQGFWPWSSAEVRAAAELSSAVRAVGKHLIMPPGTPVLATVQDAEVLKGEQSFFAHAENGDQLLIFSESRQAVLYSPSRDIIVNIGPIEYGGERSGKEAVSGSFAPVTVDLRNGSGVSGRASSVAQVLSATSEYLITQVTDAQASDYTTTLVVDNAHQEKSRKAAHSLADKLKASVVASLPDGELSSNEDIIIILGAQAP